MPSRPMLMTPARSDHRPPSPARPMGTAAASAPAYWPLEVSSSAPVTMRSSGEDHESAGDDQQHGGERESAACAGRLGAVPGPPSLVAVALARSPGCRSRRPSAVMFVLTRTPPPFLGLALTGLRGQLLADLALLPAEPVAAYDLVGDDDAQHDDALHHADDLLGVVLELQLCACAFQESPQQRAERHAHGVVAAEQRDGDAGEADARRGSRCRSCRTRSAASASRPGPRWRRRAPSR